MGAIVGPKNFEAQKEFAKNVKLVQNNAGVFPTGGGGFRPRLPKVDTPLLSEFFRTGDFPESSPGEIRAQFKSGLLRRKLTRLLGGGDTLAAPSLLGT